jgi:uncharacterized protein YjiS (DUF1127 family)
LGAVNPPSLTDVVCEAMGLTVCDELNGIDLAGWKALAPAQQSALILRLVRRAHAARSRTLGRILSRASRTVRNAWSNHLRRRRRQRDFAELITLDDLSLRDMGLSRLDIGSAIRSRTDLRSARS